MGLGLIKKLTFPEIKTIPAFQVAVGASRFDKNRLERFLNHEKMILVRNILCKMALSGRLILQSIALKIQFINLWK
jgi:hypothetical protein